MEAESIIGMMNLMQRTHDIIVRQLEDKIQRLQHSESELEEECRSLRLAILRLRGAGVRDGIIAE
jgi:hypothetical protein